MVANVEQAASILESVRYDHSDGYAGIASGHRNSQLWIGRNPVGWIGITSGIQPRAGDVTGDFNRMGIGRSRDSLDMGVWRLDRSR